jgi:hypothetical protein
MITPPENGCGPQGQQATCSQILLSLYHLTMISKLVTQPITIFDDEASMSSTLTVDRTPQKKSSAAPSKRVSFNLMKNQEFENMHLVKEEASESWYSHSDYSHFREEKAKNARVISRNAQADRDASRLSYESVMIRAYLACCKAKKDTDNILSRPDTMYILHYIDPDMLGMNKSVRIISRTYRERRSAHYDLVLGSQYVSSDCDELRAASEKISLASRMFARTLALSQVVTGDIRQSQSRGRRGSMA